MFPCPQCKGSLRLDFLGLFKFVKQRVNDRTEWAGIPKLKGMLWLLKSKHRVIWREGLQKQQSLGGSHFLGITNGIATSVANYLSMHCAPEA